MFGAIFEVEFGKKAYETDVDGQDDVDGWILEKR